MPWKYTNQFRLANPQAENRRLELEKRQLEAARRQLDADKRQLDDAMHLALLADESLLTGYV